MTPFAPATAETKSISVSASSQRVQFGTATNMKQVRVMNNGTATVWIALGDVTVTAAVATGIPIGPGVTEVISTNQTYAAAIAAGATGSIYFTPGVGI